MASGDTKTQQYLDIAANGTRADLPSDNCCNTRTQSLIVGVAERIMDVEDEVEELKNNPDVADIVATYADLQAYDTSKLTDKDIIRVLQDENHDGDSTYYRWSTTTETFTYVGESKQYVNFVGTDGTSAGVAGLVPAPAATDAGKYLKADGTWDSVQAGPTVVQTTGTSTTAVMSQDATTKMIHPNSGTGIRIGTSNSTMTASSDSIAIGSNMNENALNSIGIGYANTAKAQASVAIGSGAQIANVSDYYSIAIGPNSKVSGNSVSSAIALGANANATMKGQMDISTGSSSTAGYNNTNYRLITGVHDGQSDHDAVTVGQINNLIDAINTATGSNISHIGA